MFTGIIEGMGTIVEIRGSGAGRRLRVNADFDLSDTAVGASIAVNGVCLTAVSIATRLFQADLSPETLATSTFGRARIGERVNLERALRLSDRLDGHIVAGHVDGVGTLKRRAPSGNALILTFTLPRAVGRYVVHKGSLAIDGVSLTVNRVSDSGEECDVAIIPHTAGLTTVGHKQAGDAVNIETDLIGKYVERLLGYRQSGSKAMAEGGLNKELLAKLGYM